MPEAKLKWTKDGLAISAHSGTGHEFILRPTNEGGPSPMEFVLIALGGCFLVYTVPILQKMRVNLVDAEVELKGELVAEDPKRFKRIITVYRVFGDIPEEKLKRAIELTEEKYCRVLHSLNKDIEMETTYEIIKA